MGSTGVSEAPPVTDEQRSAARITGRTIALILDEGHGNPELKRRARLALGNPARVFLENRKDLLLVRDRLATQKTPLHLVNLPPGVSDEASVERQLKSSTPSSRKASSVASARSTSALQRAKYASTRSGCRCARRVERTLLNSFLTSRDRWRH